MTLSISPALSHRDRAVLRAIAAGRCQTSGGPGGSLIIDGLCFCDQFAGPRLTSAGLIIAGPQPGRLTAVLAGRGTTENQGKVGLDLEGSRHAGDFGS